MVEPAVMEVIQSLLSVFLMRNSHVAGVGEAGSGPAAASASTAPFLAGVAGLGMVPVGALAMAKNNGLASSPASAGTT